MCASNPITRATGTECLERNAECRGHGSSDQCENRDADQHLDQCEAMLFMSTTPCSLHVDMPLYMTRVRDLPVVLVIFTVRRWTPQSHFAAVHAC